MAAEFEVSPNNAVQGLLFQLMQTSSIIGPQSLDVLKLNNKLIWLFGDLHIPNSPECTKDGSMFLHDYLDLIFQKSPVCSDAFIETALFALTPQFEQLYEGQPNIPYYTKPATHELKFITQKYWNCLGPVKTGCEIYGNVRFHNVDIRVNPYDYYYSLNGKTIAMHLRSLSFDQLYNFWEKRLLWREILISMLDGDLATVSTLFQELYIDLPELRSAYEYPKLLQYSGVDRISKQFENIPLAAELKASLVTYLDDYLIHYSKINFVGDIITPISNRLMVITSFFMDAYTVARMVKTIYLYPDSRLIFVYTGIAHYRNIINALYTVYQPQRIAAGISIDRNLTCIDLDLPMRLAINHELEELFKTPSICAIKPSRSVLPYVPAYATRILGPASMNVMAINRKLIFLFEESRKKDALPLTNYRSMTLTDYLNGFFQQDVCSDLFLQLDLSGSPSPPTRDLGRFRDVKSRYRQCFLGCDMYPQVRFHNSHLNLFFNQESAKIYYAYFRKPSRENFKLFWDQNVITYTRILAAAMDGNLVEIGRSFRELYSEIPELAPAFEDDRIRAYFGFVSQRLQTIPYRAEAQTIILEDFVSNFKVTWNIPERRPLDMMAFTIRYLRDALQNISTITDIINMIEGPSELLFTYAHPQIISLYKKILSLYGPRVIVDIPRNVFYPNVDVMPTDQDKLDLELSLLSPCLRN